ncbi:MAG: squalene/phytoene synthase family protein [Chthoniobacterales bacterium]
MSSSMDWELVRQVSRSFYLSLRFLPGPIRETLALAYLLARASDTLADNLTTSPESRLKILRAFSEERWEITLPATDTKGLKDGERTLLERIPALLDILSAHPDADLIREVLCIIISGQIKDIERFSLSQRGVLTAEELEDYTYRVAGCVGEFWARLCFRRIPHVSALPEEKMVLLGREYGKGLQLVNILRDQQEDRKEGREYFSPENFHPLIQKAQASVDAGRQFALALRGIRLRFCCLLPYALGQQTLELLQQNPNATRVRISRFAVYRAMVRCFFTACRR